MILCKYSKKVVAYHLLMDIFIKITNPTTMQGGKTSISGTQI